MKPRDYTRLTQEKITTKARTQTDYHESTKETKTRKRRWSEATSNKKNTNEKYWFFSCPSRTLVPSQLDKDEV